MKNNVALSKEGITVFIPAYNEEDNIIATVNCVVEAMNTITRNYEVIIINDGSIDKTGSISNTIAHNNKRIKVLHHKTNMGFGQTVRDAISMATKTYITGLPGDNDTSINLLFDLIKNRNKADIIIAYMDNPNARPIVRRLPSDIFVLIMNHLFGLNLKYYNGYFLCKTALLKTTPLLSKGFTIFAEAKVRLIRANASYREIPFHHVPRKFGKSKAVSIRSVFQTIEIIFILLKELWLPKRYNTAQR